MDHQSFIQKFDKQAKKYSKRRKNNHAYKFLNEFFKKLKEKY
ncbi:hypothetical protein JOC94_004679 [Bacillus thermophilus]|uniref:Uncharacterized protein n=1 Tax=Siminovitchia thermophila TaxID=1245522 RepID=A0ABS2RDB8_9BACI|nr:hypothetical protein [Siminovitchia thermophila]